MTVSFRDCCALVLLLAGSCRAQAVRYGAEVRPILARNCFGCHGPDENARKAKLRLDIPGQAAEAPIVERITSQDPDHVMPQPRSGKSLTKEQIATLHRWVEQGAQYETHWSFEPPRRPPVPQIDGVDHTVDRFVRARLPEGLTPSPSADRVTLVRRVYLDLIGLPPTPEEADAFVNDAAPDAYEHLVDRLLGSPHYGERWARRWLDLARYADTNGYEKDRDRSIWPYRDWVIRAYNDDLPYDRFVIEQIAGDLLPDATDAQRIATGFHRNTMLNEEGGIDPLEFRFHAMTDRVATTGTVFLGLTVGCAQCHAHKFDAITHRDYYGMMAFLDNADEPDFHIVAPEEAAAHRGRLSEAGRALAELAAKWPEEAPPLATEFAAWLAEQRAKTSRWTTLHATEATADVPRLVVDASGVVYARGDTTKHDVYRLRFAPVDHAIAAVRLEALPDARLPAGGPGMTFYEGRKGDFFLSELELVADGERVEIGRATESYAKNQFGNHPVSAARTLDRDVQTGWSIAGGIGKRHLAVFELSEPIAPGSVVELTMHFGRHFASSLGKLRVSATVELRGDASTDLGEELDRLLAIPADQLTAAQRRTLRTGFLLQSERMAAHAARVRKLQRPPKRTTTLVMRERPADHRRVTHRHHRGEYLQPKEPVAPSVPKALHPFPQGVARDRLGFARWLVSHDNPLAGARRGQSTLGGSVRHRARSHGREFRRAGRASEPSGAARLARCRLHGERVVDQATAPPARYQRDLSAGVARAAGGSPPRSAKPMARGRAAVPARGRDPARRAPVCGRLARDRDVRSARAAAAARWRHRGGLQQAALEGERGCGAIPPLALHVPEAHGTVRVLRDLRCAER